MVGAAGKAVTPGGARPSVPIAEYALLSDCQGSALVARDGSVDWACVQRFDSPAVFARLLGEHAGYWRITPVDRATHVERTYLKDTMVLRTAFHTPTGRVDVTDAFALDDDGGGHNIGRSAPHAIIRVVEGVEGEVEVGVELSPRPEYGLTVPLMIACAGGLRTRGGPRAYVVSATVPLQISAGSASARITIAAGQRQAFALQFASPWERSPDPWSGDEIARRLDGTISAWRSWSSLHQSYAGPYADLVRHSGRVLQALTYAPTGAIVAAATTSLPEQPGGVRNWDYRFCWVRDASLTMSALWVAACPDEAAGFFAFLATAAGGQTDGRSALQILYGVGGERLVPEHELSHLEGYAGSRPVRVGNGAWNQTQLDVYGELLSAAALLAPQVGSFEPVTAAFLTEVADTAAARWSEPDQGIWEVRGGPRHFVYSKLMCWVALDRAIALASVLGADEERVRGWSAVRHHIRAAIETRGWSAAAHAFTQSFDEEELDASNLMMPIVGFLPATEPRMRSTIEAIAERLTDRRGFVYRYRADDGLDGDEGTFAICSFWLVQCLAMLGEVTRARELFERLTAYANDVGLMSEEIDADTDALLGNFPQAFTHIGLINAAWAIGQAEG